VGEPPANGFGLYDMHGNVWEWCQDDGIDSYDGAEHRAGDGLRVKPVVDAYRVSRGGSFGNDARLVRSASRTESMPYVRLATLGFRPAWLHPASPRFPERRASD